MHSSHFRFRIIAVANEQSTYTYLGALKLWNQSKTHSHDYAIFFAKKSLDTYHSAAYCSVCILSGILKIVMFTRRLNEGIFILLIIGVDEASGSFHGKVNSCTCQSSCTNKWRSIEYDELEFRGIQSKSPPAFSVYLRKSATKRVHRKSVPQLSSLESFNLVAQSIGRACYALQYFMDECRFAMELVTNNLFQKWEFALSRTLADDAGILATR